KPRRALAAYQPDQNDASGNRERAAKPERRLRNFRGCFQHLTSEPRRKCPERPLDDENEPERNGEVAHKRHSWSTSCLALRRLLGFRPRWFGRNFVLRLDSPAGSRALFGVGVRAVVRRRSGLLGGFRGRQARRLRRLSGVAVEILEELRVGAQ